MATYRSESNDASVQTRQSTWTQTNGGLGQFQRNNETGRNDNKVEVDNDYNDEEEKAVATAAVPAVLPLPLAIAQPTVPNAPVPNAPLLAVPINAVGRMADTSTPATTTTKKKLTREVRAL